MHSLSLQGGGETRDDAIEANNETIQSSLDAKNKRTEIRHEVHNRGKHFSDGLFKAKNISQDCPERY